MDEVYNAPAEYSTMADREEHDQDEAYVANMVLPADHTYDYVEGEKLKAYQLLIALIQ